MWFRCALFFSSSSLLSFYHSVDLLVGNSRRLMETALPTCLDRTPPHPLHCTERQYPPLTHILYLHIHAHSHSQSHYNSIIILFNPQSHSFQSRFHVFVNSPAFQRLGLIDEKEDIFLLPPESIAHAITPLRSLILCYLKPEADEM